MPSLADVAEIGPGFDRTLIRESNEVVSFVPMASVSEVSGSVTSEEPRVLSDVLKGFTPFQDRDVLVAKITPCFENGKIAHARIKTRFGFGSTEFHVVRPRADKLDDRYLFHFLRQPHIREAGERRMTGSGGQRRVPKAFLADLVVPLPPLPEQRRIAAILDKADALRAKRREAIAKLDQLLQSVFLDMFGDPVTNPKGWPHKSVGDVAEGKYGVKAGPFGSALKKEMYVPYGYRVYGQEQVIAGTLSIGNYFIDAEKFEELKACAVGAGDLLVSLVGSFGKVLVVPDTFTPGIINPRLLKISPNPRLVTPVYLQHYLQSPALQRHLATLSHGGTMGILNAGIIKQLIVPLPPISAQVRFGSFVKSRTQLADLFIGSEARMSNMFGALQQKKFHSSSVAV